MVRIYWEPLLTKYHQFGIIFRDVLYTFKIWGCGYGIRRIFADIADFGCYRCFIILQRHKKSYVKNFVGIINFSGGCCCFYPYWYAVFQG